MAARGDIDFKQLDGILQFKPSLKTVADYFGCSEDTIDRRIKEKHNKTFAEYRDIKMSGVKIKLQQKAIAMGLGGNVTMLIFCLKNLCEWSDKQDTTIKTDDKKGLTINLTPVQAKKELKKIK